MAAFPLMPKATASWLVDNTTLTFEQIADFCGLHPLEVQALADGEVNAGIMGASPITNGELTQDEIARCERNSNAKLKMMKTDLPKPRARSKGPRYTPVTKRAEKPNAIVWLIKEHPDLADVQVAKLVGSTKPTVASIRDKTHPSISSLKPVDPVSIGLCTSEELEKAVKKAERRVEREKKAAAKAEAEAAEVPVAAPAVEAPATVAETPAADDEPAAETQGFEPETGEKDTGTLG